MTSRRRSHSILFPDDSEEEDNVYTSAKYKKKKKAMSAYFIIIATFVTVICYILMKYILLRSTGVEYDDTTGKAIITSEFDLTGYTKVTGNHVYDSWQHYSLLWYRCSPIRDVIIQNEKYYFRTFPLDTPGGSSKVQYTFNVDDLFSSQSIHIRNTNSYHNAQGNFTIPPMYLDSGIDVDSNRWSSPCICTVMLDGNPASVDRELSRRFQSDVIHMFNLNEITHKTTAERPDYQTATLILSMIQTFRQPFTMDLPHHITINFDTYKENYSGQVNLEHHNATLYDPVNIVNVLNCIYLGRVVKSTSWKIHSP